jgi:hypothetical protein
MEKVTCPYCGTETDKDVCPRCYAEVPREDKDEEPVTETPAKKTRKTNKEV